MSDENKDGEPVTARDYFAGIAMADIHRLMLRPPFFSNANWGMKLSLVEMAGAAYEVADAMLKAREAKP